MLCAFLLHFESIAKANICGVLPIFGNSLIFLLVALGISMVAGEFVKSQNVQNVIANFLSLGLCFWAVYLYRRSYWREPFKSSAFFAYLLVYRCAVICFKIRKLYYPVGVAGHSDYADTACFCVNAFLPMAGSSKNKKTI